MAGKTWVSDTVRGFFQEPLAHFVVLAALAFALHAVFSGNSRDTIVVDRATQDYLIGRQEDLLARPLTEEEKQQAVESYVDEEILVREARKNGFDDTFRVRELLSQNMRFFISGEIQDPTEEQLREYYEENLTRLETGQSLEFEFVLFRDPNDAHDDLVAALNEGLDHRFVGDGVPGSPKIERLGVSRLVILFGRQGASDVLELRTGVWSGPYETTDGHYYINPVQTHLSEVIAYEDVRDWLLQEWILEKGRERVAEELEKLRGSYEVFFEEAG